MASFPLNIFFDVDYTILGLDNSLRPGTREVFQKMVDDGHHAHVWSGMGERWEVVATFGGVWVPPYFFKQSRDDQMERVYAIFSEYASTGHSQDRQYRAKGSKVPLF